MRRFESRAGKWKVTLDVFARKFTVDQKGNETDTKMNDWIQIGIYTNNKGKKDQEAAYLQQHRIYSGKQTIEIELAQKPHAAGIDPNLLLMDLKTSDNVIGIVSL